MVHNPLPLLVMMVCGAMGLSGCGFQPVYGKVSDRQHLEVATYLAGIDIDPIRGREGQMLRNGLEDRLNPQAEASIYKGAFRLAVVLQAKRDPVVVEPDGSIARYSVNLVSSYKLFDTQTGEELDSGIVRRVASYDAPIEKFAVYVAEKDALERGVIELAEDYRLRLAAYFANNYKLSHSL